MNKIDGFVTLISYKRLNWFLFNSSKIDLFKHMSDA